MEPERGMCRKCSIFSVHNVIDGFYVCPNCGHSTKIMSLDEALSEIEDIKARWISIRESNPEFFNSNAFNQLEALSQQVNNIVRSKPGLN